MHVKMHEEMLNQYAFQKNRESKKVPDLFLSVNIPAIDKENRKADNKEVLNLPEQEGERHENRNNYEKNRFSIKQP